MMPIVCANRIAGDCNGRGDRGKQRRANIGNAARCGGVPLRGFFLHGCKAGRYAVPLARHTLHWGAE
jgi:hypothetical protein